MHAFLISLPSSSNKMKLFFQIDAFDRATVTKLLNASRKGVSLMLTFDAEMKHFRCWTDDQAEKGNYPYFNMRSIGKNLWFHDYISNIDLNVILTVYWSIIGQSSVNRTDTNIKQVWGKLLHCAAKISNDEFTLLIITWEWTLTVETFNSKAVQKWNAALKDRKHYDRKNVF